MSSSTPTGFAEAVMGFFDDMPLVPRKLAGQDRVGWRLVRRLRTPRGHATNHPNDGKDITDTEQNTVDARSIATERSEVHAEVLKDASVTTAYVIIVYDAPTKTKKTTIKAFGPFGAVTVGVTSTPDGTQYAVIS